MTDAEIDELREKMREQRREIRDDLAAESVDVSSWSTLADDEADSVPKTADSD